MANQEARAPLRLHLSECIFVFTGARTFERHRVTRARRTTTCVRRVYSVSWVNERRDAASSSSRRDSTRDTVYPPSLSLARGLPTASDSPQRPLDSR